MKLQQLRYLCQVIDAGFNVTAAAGILHTSQSGISRQIRLLEQELGAEILEREGNRITGLTAVGREVAAAAQRLLADAGELKQLPRTLEEGNTGTLTVAMFHLHARYSLLPTITEFCRRYPRVRLQLSQIESVDVAELVTTNQVDIGITTAPREGDSALLHLAAYPTSMHLYVPRGHPLLKIARPSLAEIARHPLIALDPRLSSGHVVAGLFAAHRIPTNIVMTATNMDVVKAHVAGGLGVAFLRRVPLQPKEPAALRTIALDHLVPPAMAYIVLRRHRHLKACALDFLQMINPKWTAARIRSEMQRR